MCLSKASFSILEFKYLRIYLAMYKEMLFLQEFTVVLELDIISYIVFLLAWFSFSEFN